MPAGIYDRSKAKFNRGMFRKGKKAPAWLVRKRVRGILKTVKIRKLRQEMGDNF